MKMRLINNRKIATALGLSASLVLMLIAYTVVSLRFLRGVQYYHFPATEDSGVLIRENGLLTMTAKLYVVTGDSGTKSDYLQHLAGMGAITKELDQILSKLGIAGGSISDRSHVTAIERDAMWFTEHGSKDGGLSLLASKRYQDALGDYVRQNSDLLERLSSTRDQTLSNVSAIVAAIIVLSVSIFTAVAFLVSQIYRKLKEESLLRMGAERERDEQRAKSVQASKMATLGVMAGGIAHEVNTPLAIIQAHAELIAECSASERSLDLAQVAVSTEQICQTVSRVASIMRSLLLFARGGEQDHPSKVTVDDLFEDVRNLCEERLRRHGVHMECFVNGPSNISVRRGQMVQVLLNLVNNSVDAIAQLSERWVILEAKQYPDGVEISVTDSGRGIAPELWDKIMMPFFTTKEVGKGTGLGLSITQTIIRSHGGVFELDGASKNTRFVIKLPHLASTSIQDRRENVA